jgi:hypothetical protein
LEEERVMSIFSPLGSILESPVKLIHWKLSAKVGKLYVKDFLAEESPPVVLSLDMVDGGLRG